MKNGMEYTMAGVLTGKFTHRLDSLKGIINKQLKQAQTINKSINYYPVLHLPILLYLILSEIWLNVKISLYPVLHVIILLACNLNFAFFNGISGKSFHTTFPAFLNDLITNSVLPFFST